MEQGLDRWGLSNRRPVPAPSSLSLLCPVRTKPPSSLQPTPSLACLLGPQSHLFPRQDPGSVQMQSMLGVPCSPPPPTSISLTTFTWSSFFRMAISWYTLSRGSSCLAGPPWAAWDPLGGGRPVARKKIQSPVPQLSSREACTIQ